MAAPKLMILVYNQNSLEAEQEGCAYKCLQVLYTHRHMHLDTFYMCGGVGETEKG